MHALEELSDRLEAMNINQTNSLLAAVRELSTIETKALAISAQAKTLLSSLTNEVLVSQRQIALLDSLKYPMMRMRENNIQQAHVGTFSWILQRDYTGSAPDPLFMAWLASDGGVYWIAGKPGSGKSTLLKLIASDKEVRQALGEWAGSMRLVVAAHYFWYGGYELQKSEEGLLRALLCEIFTNCPGMMPILCTKRWEGRLHQTQPWTVSELRDVFDNLAQTPMMESKFCFFIDGLDEFSGDHDKMASVLKSLSRCSHIKICVSSREWLVFERQFNPDSESDVSAQMIRLQDYTKADIERFAASKLEFDGESLEPNQGHQQSSRTDNKQMLVKEVSHRAQGVFLWVRLVCDELVRGHLNYDSWEMLLKRLRSLPTDLEPYFSRMIQSIDRVYWDQSAFIFRLLLAAETPLPLLFFDSLSTPGFPVDIVKDQILDRHSQPNHTEEQEILGKQVKVRGVDLVEVYPTSNSVVHLVAFMHRTVYDFLSLPTQQEIIMKMMQKPFSPDLYLCWQYLRSIRQNGQTNPLTTEQSITRNFTQSLVHHMLRFEIETKTTHQVLLDELDHELSKCPSAICPLVKIDQEGEPKRRWTSGCILELAVSSSLIEYVSATVKQHPELTRRPTCSLGSRRSWMFRMSSSILALAVSTAIQQPTDIQWQPHDPAVMHHRRVSMVKILLQRGLSPNGYLQKNGRSTTPWIETLTEVSGRRPVPEHDVDVLVALKEASACDHFFDTRTRISGDRPSFLHLTRTQLRRINTTMANAKCRQALAWIQSHWHCYLYGLMSVLLLVASGPFAVERMETKGPVMAETARFAIKKWCLFLWVGCAIFSSVLSADDINETLMDSQLRPTIRRSIIGTAVGLFETVSSYITVWFGCVCLPDTVRFWLKVVAFSLDKLYGLDQHCLVIMTLYTLVTPILQIILIRFPITGWSQFPISVGIYKIACSFELLRLMISEKNALESEIERVRSEIRREELRLRIDVSSTVVENNQALES